MSFLLLLPVILSFLLAAAHYLRTMNLIAVAILLLLPLLLFIRRPWAVRVIQFALLLCAAIWLRTIYTRIEQRQSDGEDWLRMAIILGAVTAFTALSGFVFASNRLRRRYWPTAPGGLPVERATEAA